MSTNIQLNIDDETAPLLLEAHEHSTTEDLDETIRQGLWLLANLKFVDEVLEQYDADLEQTEDDQTEPGGHS